MDWSFPQRGYADIPAFTTLRWHTLTDLTRPDQLPDPQPPRRMIGNLPASRSRRRRHPAWVTNIVASCSSKTALPANLVRTCLLAALNQVNNKIAPKRFSSWSVVAVVCRPRFLCSNRSLSGMQQENVGYQNFFRPPRGHRFQTDGEFHSPATHRRRRQLRDGFRLRRAPSSVDGRLWHVCDPDAPEGTGDIRIAPAYVNGGL